MKSFDSGFPLIRCGWYYWNKRQIDGKCTTCMVPPAPTRVRFDCDGGMCGALRVLLLCTLSRLSIYIYFVYYIYVPIYMCPVPAAYNKSRHIASQWGKTNMVGKTPAGLNRYCTVRKARRWTKGTYDIIYSYPMTTTRTK